MKHIRCIIEYKNIHSLNLDTQKQPHIFWKIILWHTPVPFAIFELPILMAMSFANNNLSLCSVLDHNTSMAQHLALLWLRSISPLVEGCFMDCVTLLGADHADGVVVIGVADVDGVSGVADVGVGATRGLKG